MRIVLLASLRTHTRRYVAALVAVTIAVAFVVVINALGTAARSAIASGVEAAYPQADLIIGEEYGIDESDPDRILELAARRGDHASVIAVAWTRVTGPHGALGAESQVGSVATEPTLRSQEVTAGRAPRTDTEALVSASTAEAADIAIGDRLTVGSGEVTRLVTVVGLAKPSSYLDADVYLTWPAMAGVDGVIPDAVTYSVAGGDLAGAEEALSAAAGSTVQTRDEYVAARIVSMNQGVDILSYLLLLFAAIAGFVAVLVIANTFTILFAQRSRDFALLRCVGATRRQLLRSVRIEAFVLALVAATTGIIGGLAGGYLIAAVVRAFAGDGYVGPVSYSPSWLIAAFVGGVITTVVAAWFPTRAVVRVSPMAALRPAEGATARTTAGRVRIALGAVAGLGGLAALVVATGAESMPLMLLGGMVSFVGVLLLGPILVPALLRLLGRIGGRLGAPIRIAAANAVRNPRRSAATTASLLVGVTLATAVLTGMASARQAVSAEMDAEYPVDLALSGTRSIPAKTVDRIRKSDGVAEVIALAGTRAEAEGTALTLVAPTDTERDLTRDPQTTRVDEEEILLPGSVASTFADGIPERLTVETEFGAITLVPRIVTAAWGEAAIVSQTTLEQLAPQGVTRVLWILANDGADPDELAGTIGAITRGTGLELVNNLQDQQWVAIQLDVLVWSVLGLLGVGIAIALVGIANTVGLSVLERAREHALLRALGLTRRGLRRMLAAEGMLLALVAALLGTAIGTTYAWFGVATVVQPTVPTAALVIPWGQLAFVLLAASVAGLLSCVMPARRAARIMPAQGLTLD